MVNQKTIAELQENTTKNIREISDDLKALRSHVLSPFTEVQEMSWLSDKNFLLVSGFGLIPLVSIVAFASSGQTLTTYWALALYFSAFWAFLFYSRFSPTSVNSKFAILAFSFTAFLSMSVLLYIVGLPPLSWIRSGIYSQNDFFYALSFVFGVGIPEEICKLAVVYWIVNRLKADNPKTELIMFYGLISGLGFGVFEGLEYQTGYNSYFNSSSTYLLNVLRLTSLPFIHAIWTAIGAYYLSLTIAYPHRKKGLVLLAVLVPGLIHGLYDVFSMSFIGVLIAFLGVYLMNYYRTRSTENMS